MDFFLKMWPLPLSYWNGRGKKTQLFEKNQWLFLSFLTVPEVAELSRYRNESAGYITPAGWYIWKFATWLCTPTIAWCQGRFWCSDISFRVQVPHELPWTVLELHVDSTTVVCFAHDTSYIQHTDHDSSFTIIPKDIKDKLCENAAVGITTVRNVVNSAKGYRSNKKKKSGILEILLLVIDRH